MSEHAVKEYLKTLESKIQSAEFGDYNNLANKPSIESVTLSGDNTFANLGLEYLTNLEIEELLEG